MKQVSVRFYDALNLGDDLLVRILASRYHNKFKVSRQAKQRTFQDVDNIDSSTNIVQDYCRRIKHRALRKVGRIRINLDTRRSDLVVYVGGSIFIESDNLSRWDRELRFYKSLKIPYYIIGSNIGPYKSPEFLSIVKEIVAGSRDTCLRDTPSYDLVKEFSSARLATDIAFAFDSSLFEVKRDKLAIFSLIDAERRFGTEISEKYESDICRMTESLVSEGYKVVYMSFCKREGDEDVNYRVLSSLEPRVRNEVKTFNYDGNFTSAMSLLASSELIVASRFHASIIGFVFGKKVLPMAYSNKTINVLKDIGFHGPVIDIREINQFDSASVDFGSIPVFDVTEQRMKAERQFEKLDEVLERRSSKIVKW